jgi:hypothetical protein
MLSTAASNAVTTSFTLNSHVCWNIRHRYINPKSTAADISPNLVQIAVAVGRLDLGQFLAEGERHAVVVHLAGVSVDQDGVDALAARHLLVYGRLGARVVEVVEHHTRGHCSTLGVVRCTAAAAAAASFVLIHDARESSVRSGLDLTRRPELHVQSLLAQTLLLLSCYPWPQHSSFCSSFLRINLHRVFQISSFCLDAALIRLQRIV